jgi:acyl phosphate:glycerol-3-phosphate acyltransferase
MSGFLAETGFLICAYLIGSFPYVVILCRARDIKIDREEDYHIALWAKGGFIAGASGILVDIIKGILVIILGFLLDFRLVIIVCAGVIAVIGQMWPMFQKFNGGKGNTTAGGMIIALSILLGNSALFILYSAVFFFLVGFLTRTIPRFLAKKQTAQKVSIFSGPPSNSLPFCILIVFIVMPIISWAANQPVEITLGLVVLFILIVIRRLTADITMDLQSSRTGVGKILINRFLLDRSYFRDQG